MTYLTTAEVATVLRESRENVSRRCKRGELAASRVGRRWLISQESLDAFLTPVKPAAAVPEPAFLSASHKREMTRAS